MMTTDFTDFITNNIIIIMKSSQLGQIMKYMELHKITVV